MKWVADMFNIHLPNGGLWLNFWDVLESKNFPSQIWNMWLVACSSAVHVI